MDSKGQTARWFGGEERPDRGTTALGLRKGLRLASAARAGGHTTIGGPEKYRVLDLQRRRAQIRARHALA